MHDLGSAQVGGSKTTKASFGGAGRSKTKPDFRKDKYGTQSRVGHENSDSGSSLEKLYSPTAAIKVNKSKPSVDSSNLMQGT